ncbi:unnamed protein product [Leuciscus chuanchicus]
MLLTCPLCPSKVVHLRHHLRSQHQIENSEERKILLKLARGRIKLRNIRCPECDIIFENVERHLKSGHPELTGKRVKLLTKQLKKELAEEQLQKLNNGQQLDPPVLSALDGPVETPLPIPEECLQLLALLMENNEPPKEAQSLGRYQAVSGTNKPFVVTQAVRGTNGHFLVTRAVRGTNRPFVVSGGGQGAVGRFLVKLAVRGTNRLFVSVGVVGGGHGRSVGRTGASWSAGVVRESAEKAVRGRHVRSADARLQPIRRASKRLQVAGCRPPVADAQIAGELAEFR